MNELFPSSIRDSFLAKMKRRACQHAKTIVVVSERTKKDLLVFYPFVDPGRVHVTYNGVDNDYFPDTRSTSFSVGHETFSPRGYFLYVGTRGYCKNFPFALKVLAEARAQGLDLPLVVVGGGSLSEMEWSYCKEQGIPREAICQISGIPNATLRVLYSNCIALLIPSIYEGFGLPAAEAARCGALVLSARGSALDEIVGETDYAFDLSCEHEPSRVLALGLDSPYAESERYRMKARSQKFNWDLSTKKLLDIYNEI
jgi:mannosyltransferase